MTDDPTRPTDPTRAGHRGGAVWCDEHQRWECTKRVKASRGGGRCHGSAIVGVDRCRMHGGKAADLLRVQGEAVTAWSALSGATTIVPAEAVLGMLQMSWLRVHLYAGLLEQQVSAAQAEAVREPADDEPAIGFDTALHERSEGAPAIGPGTGLIGHTFSGVKDIGIFATGEAIRGLTQLEAAERDRCVRYAKTAHDMGIADRQIKLAEEQGALLAGVVGRVSEALLAAVVALLGAAGEDVRAAAETVRLAWPGWVTEIVPRELRAVAGGEG